MQWMISQSVPHIGHSFALLRAGSAEPHVSESVAEVLASPAQFPSSSVPNEVTDRVDSMPLSRPETVAAAARRNRVKDELLAWLDDLLAAPPGVLLSGLLGLLPLLS